MINSPFLSNAIIDPLERLQKRVYKSQAERNNLILDVIRTKEPISKYKLHKITGLAYGTIKQICKDFEYCGIANIKISMGTNGLPVKLVYINHSKGDEIQKKNDIYDQQISQDPDYWKKIQEESDKGALAKINKEAEAQQSQEVFK